MSAANIALVLLVASFVANTVRSSQSANEGGLEGIENNHLTDPFAEIPHHGSAQAAMYSRELAQSSAMCCPLGCREERLKDMSTEELLDEEAELLVRRKRAAKKEAFMALGTSQLVAWFLAAPHIRMVRRLR